MKKQSKRLVSFALAMLFVLSLIPMCMVSALEGADALVLDMSYTITTFETVYVTFTPDQDGFYSFESYIFDEDSGVDPRASLYVDDTPIEYNDDGGNGWNFRIVQALTAGVEYVLEVDSSNYSEDSFSVSVIKLQAPDSMNFEYDEYFGYEDDQIDMYLYYTPEDSYASIDWAVSDTSVLEINYSSNYYGYSYLQINALKEGVATITAKCGSVECSTQVVVEKRPVATDIKISQYYAEDNSEIPSFDIGEYFLFRGNYHSRRGLHSNRVGNKR